MQNDRNQGVHKDGHAPLKLRIHREGWNLQRNQIKCWVCVANVTLNTPQFAAGFLPELCRVELHAEAAARFTENGFHAAQNNNLFPQNSSFFSFFFFELVASATISPTWTARIHEESPSSSIRAGAAYLKKTQNHVVNRSWTRRWHNRGNTTPSQKRSNPPPGSDNPSAFLRQAAPNLHESSCFHPLSVQSSSAETLAELGDSCKARERRLAHF